MSNTITIEELNSLQPYQAERVSLIVRDFIKLNEEANTYHFVECPKCHSHTAYYTKAGFANSGKQMLRCSECKHRFVIDRGQLTFYSHFDQSVWNDLTIDTIEGKSLKETAAKLNVNESTVFRMRHKLLHSMEQLECPDELKGEIEIDEKYFNQCHKGTKIEGFEGKKRGTPANKRGISEEQVCVLTVVQRMGESIIRSFNMARPSAVDIANIENQISDDSFIWTDGHQSYNQLFKNKHCGHKVVKDHTEYDKVNHLNNVNSLHSMMERRYSHYRGVATKYINRYCALFYFLRKFASMDINEYSLILLSLLREKCIYFFQKQISKESIFLYAYS